MQKKMASNRNTIDNTKYWHSFYCIIVHKKSTLWVNIKLHIHLTKACPRQQRLLDAHISNWNSIPFAIHQFWHFKHWWNHWNSERKEKYVFFTPGLGIYNCWHGYDMRSFDRISFFGALNEMFALFFLCVCSHHQLQNVPVHLIYYMRASALVVRCVEASCNSANVQLFAAHSSSCVPYSVMNLL